MKGSGLFLFAVGGGALAGSAAGRQSMPFAIGAVVVGLLLAVAGSLTRGGGDLIEDAGAPDRPALSGLGTRVEQILRLAEEQAEDHRAEARREADGIIAAAHAEARRIHPE
ncbi:hypothetical protein BC793_111108 [Actinoplanes xinjiangensis]|jgi:hypothetical protein|uniref:Uncharacterized protein n=1 Tax=Actinoplanes xinjiangensis TaxID=512350 RepID=A0A316FD80_9ACTN|nr:hypothetical protein BC793_111108 [Actinoplanes xinjiangensis]GIF41531.1 hypothetical protein Axi01nite_58420 [Actinoplanes xinjiangensis]